MPSTFTELSLVILVTTAVSVIMRILRQPLILGYILAGLLVGPSALGLIRSSQLFEAFSTIGIALLLFIIGLGMNARDISKLGKVVLTIAFSILTTVSILGIIFSLSFGFTSSESILVGLALFFSSTIIIVKILSDKKEQHRLHGQIAIGVILFDDLVATLALLFIAANKDGGLHIQEALLLAVKGALLLGVLIFCSIKVLPRFARFVASSQELLFLTAIGWGFGVASLFEYIGFSIEIGALFAGVALASSPYSQEISARLKPLRDFFIILFFIVLGESMNITNLSSGVWPAVMLSIIVIVLKPTVIIATMGVLGYAKRISFKTGINLSQISEFSIIMIVLAAKSGIVRPEISAVITLVAIITIAVSTYLMLYDNSLYSKFFQPLRVKIFERTVKFKDKRKSTAFPIVLFGYHDGGNEFIKIFQVIGKRFLVVDYDPSVTDLLETKKIPTLYGDATDTELLDEIGLDRAELIVSSFTDFEATRQLVAYANRSAPQATVISHASNQLEAKALYELGSTYVIVPHHIGSQKIGAFIKEKGYDKQVFTSYRNKHLNAISSYL